MSHPGAPFWDGSARASRTAPALATRTNALNGQRALSHRRARAIQPGMSRTSECVKPGPLRRGCRARAPSAERHAEAHAVHAGAKPKTIRDKRREGPRQRRTSGACSTCSDWSKLARNALRGCAGIPLARRRGWPIQPLRHARRAATTTTNPSRSFRTERRTRLTRSSVQSMLWPLDVRNAACASWVTGSRKRGESSVVATVLRRAGLRSCATAREAMICLDPQRHAAVQPAAAQAAGTAPRAGAAGRCR